MSRTGQGVYELPSGYKATPGTTVLASQHNTPLEDLAAEQNATRPIAYGGTGANTSIGALDNLRRRSTSIASDTTVDLTGSTGDLVHITGTTTIEGFASQSAGNERTIVFDGALTLTHDADSFILPGGSDITTGAGDTAVFRSEGSGNWRCISFQKASGEAVNPHISLSDLPWLSRPIGEPFPLWTHLDGVDPPPTNNDNYRYIDLTADLTGSGQYNEGCLTNQITSGSFPLVQATAEISLPGSPLIGETVRLINTEERFLRAAELSGAHENDSMQGHFHGGHSNRKFVMFIESPGGTSLGTGSDGIFIINTSGSPTSDGANGTPRTSNETRPKYIAAKYFMRIK